jgi:RNA polymerase sigma-70 factor (ECF subfamily)
MTAPVWDLTDRKRLVGLCATISGDPSAAEDLAQETLYEVWRNAHKLVDASGRERWVNAIARNVCRRWYATQNGQRVLVAGLEGSAEIADDTDLQRDLERAELVDLLDRALSLLPTPTRDVLVARYLEDSSPAEIASRLGVSPEAVSMRVSRGKVMLRRVLETDLRPEVEPHVGRALSAGSSRRTDVWCAECGRARLVMTETASPATVWFSCPRCTPGADGRTHVFDLTNPTFARLLGPVTRPTAILRRAASWADHYFLGPERGRRDNRMVDCTRCGRRVRVRRYRREGSGFPDAARLGLAADCSICGQEVSSSLGGLALAQPAVQSFRRRHPRIAALPLRRVDTVGRSTLVVGYRETAALRGIDVVFDATTLAIVGVDTPAR